MRIVSGVKWRLLDASLLISVIVLALLRAARIPLLIWYFGPELTFPEFNGSSLELALLAGESLLTLGIITLVIAAIIAETIATFRHQSERDGLTGLLNRRAFDILAGTPALEGGVVIFCDIDHFKQINDRFGHQAGDDVICSLAGIIGKTGYPAGRIGGEEFAILVPDGSLREGLDLAEMFRARFKDTTHAALDDDTRVSASFGVAAFTGDATPQTAFAAADRALYKAKRNGRNRVEAEHPPATPDAQTPRQVA
nr:GGDEF domain-containing protein [Devosia ureilytica]